MINRLLGMIYILMKQGTVTAAELAERFEVSVRTIYRDMDTLSAAGIPVYAKKGKNGGICLTEQFVLNKMLLTQEEQQEILSGLISLRETRADGEENILQKLGEFFKTDPVDWLAIDLSDWSGRRKQLYEDIKNAILERKLIRFDYYGQHAQMSSRTVEPVQLLFKEYTWYLKAFCREKSDWRVFKLFRIKRLEILNKTFVPRERWDPEEDSHSKEEQSSDNGSVPIDIWIDKKEAYRIYDRFEEDEIEVLPDGNFMVHMHASVDDWVYGVILGFGPSAEVIAPDEIRQEIRRRIRDMAERYQI
ncbi:MAG: YafY family transcriptional regulator [Lachnospiraceae bacterium]|nr:YafY family transcriptional regulator [Lachnospiraceae bacterium]MDE7202948.1 YafY family transcriptional regulator [Lachnospiraceae bacterium]